MSEDFSKYFCNANGVSPCQYQKQRMAHWMQGNNNVFLQYQASNKDNYPKGGYFQVENTQNREGKMLSIDSTHGNNLHDRNIFRSDTEFRLALCSEQSAETLGRYKEGSLELQKNLKMEDAGVGLSDTLSLQKLADASPNITGNMACSCLNPEDIISHDHFPMYGINRKICGIFNRAKRSARRQMASRLSERQMQYEEHNQSEAQGLTSKAPKTELTMTICKDELTCSSKPAGGSFSFSRPNFMLSSFTELRMDSWCIDHGHNKHSTIKFKHDPCDLSGSSRFCHSETKDNNEMISGCIRSSKPQKIMRFMSFNRDMRSDDLHFSSVSNQHDKYQINTASKTKANCSGFAHIQSSNDLGLLHQKLVNIDSCFANDAETLGIHTTSNSTDNMDGGSQSVSNSFRSWLISKNMCGNLSQREQLNVNPTQCAKSKNTALYEMLAIPAILNKQPEDSQHLVISRRSSHCDEESWNDAHIMISKTLATKTTTSPNDICQNEVSLEAVVSAMRPKDSEHLQLIKFQSLSPLPVEKEICKDTNSEMVDGHTLLPTSENTGSSNHREPSVSRTESMNVDPVLSHVQNLHVPSSISVLESSSQIEPRSRWLKRLRHSPSDIRSIGSKRSKTGDGPNQGEACNVINYHVSNSGQQLNDVRKSSSSTAKCLPGASTKELTCWVKRWCHKNPQKTQSASALYEQENTKLSYESSEGKQFPSIAAMALMGKVMKNVRTCRFRRRGFL